MVVALETPEVTDELLDHMAEIIRELLDPDKIILFGSYAWGEPRPDSDVDLYVITRWFYEWVGDDRFAHIGGLFTNGGEFTRVPDLWVAPSGEYRTTCRQCGGSGAAQGGRCPECGGGGEVEFTETRSWRKDLRLTEVAAEASLACRPPSLALDLLVVRPDHVARRLAMGDRFVGRILDEGRVLYPER